MQRIFIPLAILATSSCASGTGISPAGPDTYTVTERYEPARGGSTEAERVALTEANAYCSARAPVRAGCPRSSRTPRL
jgi:hypothetical protein